LRFQQPHHHARTMSCSTPISAPLTPSQTGSSSIHNSPYMPAGTKRKVLVIGTGGTIASEPTANGYSPVSSSQSIDRDETQCLPVGPQAHPQLRNDHFYRRIRQHPQLSDPTGAATPTSFSSPVNSAQVGPNTLYPELVTPELDDRGVRVGYEILDLDKHMDSSEMTPAGELRARRRCTS